jgi:glutamine amidotransferase
VRFRPDDRSLKVPHMGWNRVTGREPSSGEHLYFVHSYYAAPADRSIVALEATHGVTFCAAIRTGNLFACQFHPEKSQAAGLELLRGFAEAA